MMMWKSPHFVAMDGEGKIFDPSPRYPGYYGHDRLDHPHFTKVFWVMGIWRDTNLAALGRLISNFDNGLDARGGSGA